MRVIHFAAVCLALAFACSTSSFAQTDRTKPAGTVGTTPQAGTAAPSTTTIKPSDSTRPPRATGAQVATPMTESECGNLGGAIVAGVTACLSGKACRTTGEDQQVHAVCISRQ
jgi:hypothetical protein